MIAFSKAQKRKKEIKEIIKQLKHILHVNDDILQNSTKDKVKEVLSEAEEIKMDDIEAVDHFNERAPLRIAKILPKKKYPVIREYVDILVVAFMVAFGIRALFLQPFKIPTSSMQPTLFGIHHIEEKMPDGTATLPKLPAFLHFSLYSTQEANMTMKHSGRLMPKKIAHYNKFLLFPRTVLPFQILDTDKNSTQLVDTYDMPGDLKAVSKYTPLSRQIEFEKGEVLSKGWLSQGDHLFVDRISHHFVGLHRGDIIVFNTEGLKYNGEPLRGYYFIKRLVGMPGDTLKVEDSVLMVREKGADKFVPVYELDDRFKKLYSGKGGYHGHLAGGLLSSGYYYTVPENTFFAMGDNSVNSLDSRAWGPVPRQNIVGKAFFIFWPFTRRWGLDDREGPLDVPTKLPELPAMNLQ